MAQKKATIIKVSDDKVSIGMEDGSFFDVSRKELNFLPSIGDEVSVFSNGDMKIVSKLETSTKKILPKEQNFQNYGYENGFMLKDRTLCFDLAEVDYTALYGAPLTAGEKSNFREYKASYQKGCLDGENAAGE